LALSESCASSDCFARAASSAVLARTSAEVANSKFAWIVTPTDSFSNWLCVLRFSCLETVMVNMEHLLAWGCGWPGTRGRSAVSCPGWKAQSMLD
jgi:hypothetical protein